MLVGSIVTLNVPLQQLYLGLSDAQHTACGPWTPAAYRSVLGKP